MNHTRNERIKQLAMSLRKASIKADKAVMDAIQKQSASEKAGTGHDKKRLSDESQAAWGAALAAFDECHGISHAAKKSA